MRQTDFIENIEAVNQITVIEIVYRNPIRPEDRPQIKDSSASGRLDSLYFNSPEKIWNGNNTYMYSNPFSPCQVDMTKIINTLWPSNFQNNPTES